LITFIKIRRGHLERILEDVINAPPIKYKHNPFYNGSFNGNKTERVLELINCLWVALRASLEADGTTDEEKIGVEAPIADHKPMWDSFKIIIDLYRTTRILTKAEQTNLLNEIKRYYNLLVENLGVDSITIKMHIMFEHMNEQLDEYGSIGLFAEDGLEYVHQVFNQIDDMINGVEGDLKVKFAVGHIALSSKRYAMQNVSKRGSNDNDVPLSPQKRRGAKESRKTVHQRSFFRSMTLRLSLQRQHSLSGIGTIVSSMQMLLFMRSASYHRTLSIVLRALTSGKKIHTSQKSLKICMLSYHILLSHRSIGLKLLEGAGLIIYIMMFYNLRLSLPLISGASAHSAISEKFLTTYCYFLSANPPTEPPSSCTCVQRMLFTSIKV
jgi:hypothetical protein